ncbi:interleukin-17B [Fundulus heteroclitus]|uniref:interleukin-17B n=1 Tax=Fundulus heteroclitus TaxID=8078 RepID=UPI00165BD85E|nr:interleukin-17B [Fundulus heteroclitus]
MARLRLHMVSLCALLLLLAARVLCAVNASSRADRQPPDPHRSDCFTEEQLRSREDMFVRRSNVYSVNAQSGNRTCAQVVEEMRKDPRRFTEQSRRSLSPWEYKVDRDVERIPPEISMAQCLCEGCIINLREDHSYNSVMVKTQMTVLKRKPCPGDPKKYVVKKEIISVPVACTCVKPSYSQ